MLLVYRGEKRFLAVDLAAVMASGAALSGSPTVTIVAKRGRSATTMESTPAPAIDGTEVQFWVDVPDDQTRGNYFAIVECGTTSGEVVREEAPLLVQ